MCDAPVSVASVMSGGVIGATTVSIVTAGAGESVTFVPNVTVACRCARRRPRWRHSDGPITRKIGERSADRVRRRTIGPWTRAAAEPMIVGWLTFVMLSVWCREGSSDVRAAARPVAGGRIAQWLSQYHYRRRSGCA